MSEVRPCLYCVNERGEDVSGLEQRMHRHVSPRVVATGSIGTDPTGAVYYQKPVIQLLEWYLCPVCQVSWEMFPTAREEINLAASNAVRG